MVNVVLFYKNRGYYIAYTFNAGSLQI